MNSVRYHILCVFVAGLLLVGCEAKTRYEVLSFFFDGVPEPQQESSLKKSDDGSKTHANGEKMEDQSSRHGPFAARMCSACHEPNTNALVLPKDKLCFKCHVFPAVRRVHGPVASGGCIFCHDPHRSATSKYLLVANARDFCFYCHDRKEVLDREAHRGLTVSCIECHNPHGSDNDFFLR